MIRATVILLSINDVKEAFTHLESVPYLEIVKIKNKLATELQNVSVLFIFDKGIIGEVQMRYCEKPASYYANHFVYELERADSASQF